MNRVSIVIPIYNECANVSKLHKEVVNACEKLNREYEVIFIDDGSTDNTREAVTLLKPLKYIRFRKNFGQTAAISAGIKEAKYEYIITMDGDLQNDPNDIEKLIDYLEENNLDVVSGWRKNRKDSFLKHFVSRVANFLREIIVKDGIHDSGCSLKIYKKECFENLDLYGEMHRFIPALLKIKGYEIGEIIVNHRFRTAGKTKYNWKRAFKGFVDMLSVWFWAKYASRPLHLFGIIGLLLFSGGLASGIYTIFQYFFRGGKVGDTTWPTLTTLLILSGVMIFIFGLVTDMLGRIYRRTNADSIYSIKEKMENN